MSERDEEKRPETDASITPPSKEKHWEDAFDDKTNQIVLGLTVGGLLAAAGALAARRLRNRGEDQ